ncbi:hypothetical protein FRB91_003839 [Serendipita sp. 411]|nr:hypothetical protein FRB91_003839 [Serendipita sp. 411]
MRVVVLHLPLSWIQITDQTSRTRHLVVISESSRRAIQKHGSHAPPPSSPPPHAQVTPSMSEVTTIPTSFPGLIALVSSCARAVERHQWVSKQALGGGKIHLVPAKPHDRHVISIDQFHVSITSCSIIIACQKPD